MYIYICIRVCVYVCVHTTLLRYTMIYSHLFQTSLDQSWELCGHFDINCSPFLGIILEERGWRRFLALPRPEQAAAFRPWLPAYERIPCNTWLLRFAFNNGKQLWHFSRLPMVDRQDPYQSAGHWLWRLWLVWPWACLGQISLSARFSRPNRERHKGWSLQNRNDKSAMKLALCSPQ